MLCLFDCTVKKYYLDTIRTIAYMEVKYYLSSYEKTTHDALIWFCYFGEVKFFLQCLYFIFSSLLLHYIKKLFYIKRDSQLTKKDVVAQFW